MKFLDIFQIIVRVLETIVDMLANESAKDNAEQLSQCATCKVAFIGYLTLYNILCFTKHITK